MAEIITEKPRIGISACLYRCPVRYNGKAFDALSVIGRERSDFTFTPVCPECMAGLGVPRPPIHLTGPGEDVLAGRERVLDRRGHDRTAELIAGARACCDALDLAGVEAVILKEKSPSCGLELARIGKDDSRQAQGAGVFGAMQKTTGRFLVTERALDNPLAWWDARRRLHAWLWLRRRDITKSSELYDAWHVVKFVIQETDRPFADAMGRDLAALPKRPSRAALEELRARMLDALGTPSNKRRIRGALWKTYTHHRKHGRLEGLDTYGLDPTPPSDPETLMRLADDLIRLERISFDSDVLFGTSPVIRRDRGRVRARDAAREGQGEGTG